MVFDKTGTLTEEGLSVQGFKSVINGKFDKFKHELNQFGNMDSLIQDDGQALKYVECMASCHSASKIDDLYIGDPLDIKMLQATKWVLDETQG
jgi:cation-transporting P-type ATPase 13A2